MVALDGDGGALVRHGLDDVRVQRALGQELRVLHVARGLLEHGDELAADDLPLLLRVRHPGQLVQEALAGIHRLQRDVEAVHEERLHLGALVLPQHPVVHEDALEPGANGPVQQQRGHGAVHAARQRADDPAVLTYLAADGAHGLVDEALHRPRAADLALVEDEGAQHGLALRRVDHLRVELDAEPGLRRVGGGGEGRIAAAANGLEAGGSASTRSPWLIQTWTLSPGVNSAKGPRRASTSTSALPNSRWALRSILPPSSLAVSWRP